MLESISWLTRHWKHFPVPRIVYIPSLIYYGQYQWPSCQEEIIDDIVIPPSRGTILLGPNYDAGTIAHEYRHHLQFWQKGGWWDSDFSIIGDPSFITRHDSELDAVQFEVVLTNDISSRMLQDRAKIITPSRSDMLCYIPVVKGATWLTQ